MDKATQKTKILQYCEDHGSITIRDAFETLFINSPSKRISEMRLSGLYDVQQTREYKVKESGESVYYNRYFISKI